MAFVRQRSGTVTNLLYRGINAQKLTLPESRPGISFTWSQSESQMGRCSRPEAPCLAPRWTRYGAKMGKTKSMLIELSKLCPAPGTAVKTSRWETYEIGSADNAEALPVDYTMTGYLLDPLEVGKTFRLLRVSRNGVPFWGLYVSTPVAAITESTVITRNSVYIMKVRDTAAAPPPFEDWPD